ncbi:MAG: thioredoxin family protein [Sphingomonadaceae bacterium]|nr:thioredoxin family protein [Sphingomonadaceae bacterium]
MDWLRCGLMTLVATLCALSTPVSAQNHIKAALVAESSEPAPGKAFTIAILMQPEQGWHGYWQNPGDAGLSAQLRWTLPNGATVSAPRYPVPERLVIADLMNHVYNTEHALLATLTIPPHLAKGTRLPLRMSIDRLACTDKICVPEHDDLALDLTVGDGAIAAADRARFDAWRMKLPRPLGSVAHFQIEGPAIRIGIPYPANRPATDPWFFSTSENALNYAAPQKVSRVGDMLVIETSKASYGFASPKTLEGVVALGKGEGLTVSAVPGTVEKGGSDTGLLALALALGGAILGGLILNVMPCVFPVISLKAISLARAGSIDEGEAKREALAYAAGVIATCLALGGALLALRAGGLQVGWAFQLQDPRVILFLTLLASAITLNLLGMFHLRSYGGGDALASRGGSTGAFWTGVLAAFVATPCTGPFMAAALGAALVLPVPAALAIFAGLGLGLALPFLGLGFVPALRRMVPKPGAWMATFQRILAIPMALTVAALLWLLWRQTGQTGLNIGIAGSVLVGLLGWIGGRSRPLGVVALTGFAAVSAGAAYAMPFLFTLAPAHTAVMGAEPFSEGRLTILRKANTPVFLYFTADWCLTCKVNEKAAIDRAETKAAFDKAGVTVMVGDWTNGDPEITRFLEAHGRSGVPLYLWYAKGMAEPVELPQVLTTGTLTALVN